VLTHTCGLPLAYDKLELKLWEKIIRNYGFSEEEFREGAEVIRSTLSRRGSVILLRRKRVAPSVVISKSISKISQFEFSFLSRCFHSDS